MIRSTWDYQARRDEFLAWARGSGDGWSTPDVLAWNTDKRYLRELADAGLPVVPTLRRARRAIRSAADSEYVVKPTVSAGSRDTARFTADSADARAPQRSSTAIHASGRTAMVQPYLASVDERGETAMLFFGGAFSHAIHKGPLLQHGADADDGASSRAETIEPREATAAERAVADACSRAHRDRFGPLAYARVDLVEDADGEPLVLELELTEPSLFFSDDPGRLSEFAGAIRAGCPSADAQTPERGSPGNPSGHMASVQAMPPGPASPARARAHRAPRRVSCAHRPTPGGASAPRSWRAAEPCGTPPRRVARGAARRSSCSTTRSTARAKAPRAAAGWCATWSAIHAARASR